MTKGKTADKTAKKKGIPGGQLNLRFTTLTAEETTALGWQFAARATDVGLPPNGHNLPNRNALVELLAIPSFVRLELTDSGRKYVNALRAEAGLDPLEERGE